MIAATARRGFTLIELLVSMVVLAIIATSLVRALMFEVRFSEDREAWRTARQAARSGLTVLTSDLRMVETSGGVEAASASGLDVTVRVPYAFGVLCATNGSASTVTLMPVDSAMYAQSGMSGFAWRNETSGAYTYVAGGSVSGTGNSSTCTTAGITVVTGATVVNLSGTVPNTLAAGTIVLLYRRIRYEIKASAAIAGQTGLWRTAVTSGATEEIAAPFASTARFRYLVGTGGTVQSTVPSPLSTISGLELAFTGRSDKTPRNATGPKTVEFTTSLYFQNQTP